MISSNIAAFVYKSLIANKTLSAFSIQLCASFLLLQLNNALGCVMSADAPMALCQPMCPRVSVILMLLLHYCCMLQPLCQAIMHNCCCHCCVIRRSEIIAATATLSGNRAHPQLPLLRIQPRSTLPCLSSRCLAFGCIEATDAEVTPKRNSLRGSETITPERLPAAAKATPGVPMQLFNLMPTCCLCNRAGAIGQQPWISTTEKDDILRGPMARDALDSRPQSATHWKNK